MQFADTVFYNAKVVTVNADDDIAEAVAVKDGRIMAVGSREEILALCGADTERTDLGGATLLPGIHDAHVHASDFIHNMHHLACDTCSSIAQLQDSLRAFRPSVESGWLLGNGLTQPVMDEGSGISCHDLDAAVSDIPVILVMWHGHGCVANSAAMKASGISRDTPDPAGGVIERDPSGEPTGVMQEASALQLMFRGMPKLSVESIAERLEEVQRFMNSMGYTAYTECTAGPANNEREGGASGEACLQAYQKLLEEGKLSCRVSVGFYSGRSGIQSDAILREDLPSVPRSKDEHLLRFRMLKFFCDGVDAAHTAWMKQDYADAPGNHGLSCFGPPGASDAEQEAQLREIIRTAHRSGMQIGIHCVGNKAVEKAVDAIIAAQQEYPLPDRRHCIIHGDTFGDLEDLLRGAEAGIIVSAQPALAESMYEKTQSCVGEEFGARMMGLRNLFDGGVVVAGGSDSIAGGFYDWRQGIRCAMERRSAVSGRLHRQDLAITVSEALRMYTVNAAYQEFSEQERGSVEVGKFADFTVIDGDIFALSPAEIGRIRVLRTVLGGKTVYENSPCL